MSTKEQRKRIELPQGERDLLILRMLLAGPAHGHATAKAIEFDFHDVLQGGRGSLYAAPHPLTAEGRRQLVAATSKWHSVAGSITRISSACQEGES